MSSGECTLCGLPTGQSKTGYCCSGCERVHEILRASGYDGDPHNSPVFREAVSLGVVSGGVQSAEPAKVVQSSPKDERTFQCELGGLWCTSCAWLIDEALSKTPGVKKHQVSFVADRATVRYDPRQTDAKRLKRVITRLGYEVLPMGTSRAQRFPLLRFGIAAFFTVNVMVFSYAFYADRFFSAPPLFQRLLPWLLAVFCAPVVFGAGWPILKRGWKATVTRRLTMDTLISLGSLSAYGYSLWVTFDGGNHVYFDGASALVTFWLLGRLIESHAFSRAQALSSEIGGLLPKKVRLVDGQGGTRWVAANRVKQGDVVQLQPHERCPVDGVLHSDTAHISTAVISGESLPRKLVKGAFVPAGAVSGDSPAQVKVLRPAGESMLADMARRVEEGSGKRAGRVDLVDAVARLFLPAVLITSAVTFLYWIGQHLGGAVAFERALTVLVVSCPCAMGLAAPLARVIANGRLAGMGVIVRDEGIVDDLFDAKTVAFDKTGTLTDGVFSVVAAWRPPGAESDPSWLGALEQQSSHPVARALVTHFDGARATPVRDITPVVGNGVTGVLDDGAQVAVGRPSWIGSLVDVVPLSLRQFMASHEKAGRTIVVASENGKVVSALALGDSVRGGVKQMVAALKSLQLSVTVLSGDGEGAVQGVAKSLGIEQSASSMTPVEKADWLERRARSDNARPLFVGDGINDAPALASAVGVCVADGSDFARTAASVQMLGQQVDQLPVVIGFARRVRRTIMSNLFWAATYNVVSIPLAVMGWLNPVIAALAMVTSGVVVTLNTLRLVR